MGGGGLFIVEECEGGGSVVHFGGVWVEIQCWECGMVKRVRETQCGKGGVGKWGGGVGEMVWEMEAVPVVQNAGRVSHFFDGKALSAAFCHHSRQVIHKETNAHETLCGGGDGLVSKQTGVTSAWSLPWGRCCRCGTQKHRCSLRGGGVRGGERDTHPPTHERRDDVVPVPWLWVSSRTGLKRVLKKMAASGEEGSGLGLPPVYEGGVRMGAFFSRRTRERKSPQSRGTRRTPARLM